LIKDLCFEIIETCPNNCMFCSSNSSILKTNIIELDKFKTTIDFLCEKYGVEEISLSGGEPLLHPDLFEIIKYCKDKNIRVVLFTSGIKRRNKISLEEEKKVKENIKQKYKKYLKEGLEVESYNKIINKEISIFDYYNNQEFSELTKEDLKRLEYTGLDKIVFDFQAWDEVLYNKLMGTKNYFDYVKISMIRASLTNLKTDAHFIPNKINYKELPDIIEMLNIANFNCLSILSFVPQGRGLTNNSALALNEEEMIEFINLYNKNKDYFNGKIRLGIPLLKEDTHLCNAGMSKLVIKFDGTVLPCPAFKEIDIDILQKNKIKVCNIYHDLDKIKVYSGTRKKPLCKELYKNMK